MMKIAALPLLFAGYAAPALAQSPQRYFDKCLEDGGCVQGAQIVVRGAALPDPVGDEVYSIEIVDEPRQDERIENVLRSIAGLQQFRRTDARSANPTSQGVTLRGLGGNASSRAVLILDGVPQADPFGGWVSWPGYDAVPILEARVRRGGGTGSDGPGALAGAIELFTNSIDPLTNFSASYGSRNSVEARGAIGREIGEGAITIGGSYARGDGFTPIVEEQRGPADRGAEYEQAGLSLRAVAPISDDTELQANIRAFIDNRDRGFDSSDNENSGVDASIRFAGKGDWAWSALGYVQIRDFKTSFAAVDTIGGVARASARQVLDQFSVPSTGLGARFELRPPVGDKLELRLGADWRRSIGETNENFFFIATVPQRSRNAGGRTDTYGAFAEFAYQNDGGLTLTAGGRVDRWNIANGFRTEIELVSPFQGALRSDDQFVDRNGWEGTGRVGFAWQPGNEAFKLRGAAYMGWRLPTLNELYRPFRVGADATAANELLNPERVRGGEVGIEYDDEDALNISVTAFWNQLEDAIANVTLDSGPGLFPGVGFVSGAGVFRQRQNLDSVESRGVEADVTYDLASSLGLNSGYDSLVLRGSYAFVDAEVEASGTAAALDGLRPAQVPRHFGSLSLDYDDRTGLKAGAELRYIGQQFEDDGNSRSLDDALTLGLHLGYDLTGEEKWILRASAENIFNAEVQAAVSSSGIVERTSPRSFWLGLQLKL